MSWFALFCVSEIPIKTLNSILKQSQTEDTTLTDYWLANEDWTTAYDGIRESPTELPIKFIPLKFIGKDLESLAAELENAPEDVNLSRDSFAVVDARSAEDKTILLCCNQRNRNIDTIRSVPRDSVIRLGAQGMTTNWVDLVEQRDERLKWEGKNYIPDFTGGEVA